MKQAWLELMSIHSLITHLIDADNDGSVFVMSLSFHYYYFFSIIIVVFFVNYSQNFHFIFSPIFSKHQPRLRTHTIKYLETLIITLSFPPSPKNNDVINLSLLSDCHWLLKTEELEKEGLSCFQQLINYMGSLHISR